MLPRCTGVVVGGIDITQFNIHVEGPDGGCCRLWQIIRQKVARMTQFMKEALDAQLLWKREGGEA